VGSTPFSPRPHLPSLPARFYNGRAQRQRSIRSELCGNTAVSKLHPAHGNAVATCGKPDKPMSEMHRQKAARRDCARGTRSKLPVEAVTRVMYTCSHQVMRCMILIQCPSHRSKSVTWTAALSKAPPVVPPSTSQNYATGHVQAVSVVVSTLM
jgi:hypothetical protein